MFQSRATPTKLKLRMALAGPDKAGKSYTALALATGIIERLKEKGELHGNGKIAALDTEHERLRVYADEFEFFDECITNYAPETFIRAIDEAEKADFSFLVIDSFTHEWKGRGGVLEIHSKMGGNSFANWGKARPIHNSVIERILCSRLHVIMTVRSRIKYAMEGSTVNRIGMRPQQEKDFLFELDIVGYMDAVRRDDKMVHQVRFDGTRCKGLDGRIFESPGTDVAHTIADWLSRGGDPAPASQSLPADVAAKLREGAAAVGFDDDWWRAQLIRTGAGRIEDLTLDDARTLAAEIRKARADRERQQSVSPAVG